jgi:hypothetical protein
VNNELILSPSWGLNRTLTLQMEVVCYFEALIPKYQSRWYRNQEPWIFTARVHKKALNFHRLQRIKSQLILLELSDRVLKAHGSFPYSRPHFPPLPSKPPPSWLTQIAMSDEYTPILDSEWNSVWQKRRFHFAECCHAVPLCSNLLPWEGKVRHATSLSPF